MKKKIEHKINTNEEVAMVSMAKEHQVQKRGANIH